MSASKPCVICGFPIVDKPSHIGSRKTCSRKCRGELAKTEQAGSNNPNWRGGAILAWQMCGQALRTVPALASVRRFCSRACRAKWDATRTGPDSPSWKGGSQATKRRYAEKCGKKSQAPVCPRRCKKCGEPGVKKGRRYHPACRPFRPRVVFVCRDCGLRKLIYQRSRSAQRWCRTCSLKARGGANNSRWKGGITPANKRIRASEAYKAWRKAVFRRDNYTCIWCGQRGGKLQADHIKAFSQYPELRFDVENALTLCVE